MAIKGKKKPPSRGSQARRRPATAPRPTITPRTPPWYTSQLAKLTFAVIGVVLLGALIAAGLNARSAAAELEERQETLADYTSDVRSLLQQVRAPASEMTQAPMTTDDADLKALEENAERWGEQLQEASTGATGLTPPPDAAATNRLFVEAIASYRGAAETYALVDDVPGGDAELVLLRAIEQRDRGTAIWEAATEVLNEERGDAELDPSAIGVPTSTAPATLPASPPPGPGGDEDQGG